MDATGSGDKPVTHGDGRFSVLPALPSTVLLALLVAASLALSGCVGTSAGAGGRSGSSRQLGPLPTYPPETSGWDTSQTLMVASWTGLAPADAEAELYAIVPERLAEGLRQRGYAVVACPTGVAGLVTVPLRRRISRVIVPGGTAGRQVKLADGRIGREVVFSARVCTPEQLGDVRAGRIFLAVAQGYYSSPADISAETERQLLFAAMDRIFCVPGFRQALQ